MDRPDDLTEFLSLLAQPNGDPTPEHLTYLWHRVRSLARQQLPVTDVLRTEMDSEDLAQDALLHLIQHVNEFRGSTWGEFIAFVRSIVHHERVDRHRHWSRQKRTPDPAAEREAGEPETPSTIISSREEQEILKRQIEELPELLRTVLQARLAGAGYSEVAEQVGISEVNARQRISRALGILRAKWRGSRPVSG